MVATRKSKAPRRRKTQKHKNGDTIQHHHLLLRLETSTCPTKQKSASAKELLLSIVRDTHMKVLGEPRVFYVEDPDFKEGLTGIVPIQTSHIAFHFWKHPEKRILHSKKSECLLEFDLYTCGSLSLKNIQTILHHLTKFKPTHANLTLLNRKYSLTLERQLLWDESSRPWTEWVNSIPNM